MDLAENLGKSRKMALNTVIVNLFIPIAIFVLILYLAFSKSAVAGGLAAASGAGAVPDLSGEPDLDLPDIPEDFDDMGDMGDMDGDEDFDQTMVDDFDEMTGGDDDDMDFDEPKF